MPRRYMYLLVCGGITVFSIVGNMVGIHLAFFSSDISSIPRSTVVSKNATTRSELFATTTERQTETDCLVHDQLRRSSFQCPAKKGPDKMLLSPGHEFQQTYMENMISMYNGTDDELFSRCMNLSIPLKSTYPAECWPRPVILASFPTSGNGLFRKLLNNLTFPMQTSMLMYKSGETPIPFYKITPKGSFIGIHGNLDEPLALPLMNRVVVFKSHYGGDSDTNEYRIVRKLLHGAVSRKKLFGILRLARNPGDNILRNTFRWRNYGCYKMGDDCFFDQAPKLCSFFGRNNGTHLKGYTQFHSTWNEFDLDLPQHIVHYEHITNKTHAPEVLTRAMEFLNSLMPDTDYSSFYEKGKVLKMTSIIKEPDYEHGTILARVCGKEIARIVHNQTLIISERLGYVFDFESATWSLDPQKLANLE
eukprot:scaffold22640_cov138-Cylindrotheca_fusiformis.AAC.5